MSAGSFILSPGRYEQVYDIVNCGPLNRFTVLDGAGLPFIVHNCVQAIARDCLYHGMMKVHEAGYKVIMHVHDEIVCEDSHGSIEEVNELFATLPPWATGLPLATDGFESLYYKK